MYVFYSIHTRYANRTIHFKMHYMCHVCYLHSQTSSMLFSCDSLIAKQCYGGKQTDRQTKLFQKAKIPVFLILNRKLTVKKIIRQKILIDTFFKNFLEGDFFPFFFLCTNLLQTFPLIQLG